MHSSDIGSYRLRWLSEVRTVVLPTSDFVATLGIGAAGSLRPNSGLKTGDNDSVARNPNALQDLLAVRGSEALSTKKLAKATASLARYQSTSLLER